MSATDLETTTCPTCGTLHYSAWPCPICPGPGEPDPTATDGEIRVCGETGHGYFEAADGCPMCRDEADR